MSEEDYSIEEVLEETMADLKEANDSVTWWHNRFNAVQRDYEELKKRNKELEDGFKATTDELCEYAEKIDKAIEEINYMITNADITEISAIKLKQILGDKENE